MPQSIFSLTIDLRQISSVIPVLWLFGAACVKFSILAFYRRIFVGKTFNAVSWFLITLNALWTGYAFFAWLFFCGRHVKENFEGSWKVCPSWGTKMQIGVFSWDTLIDFCLLATPIPFVSFRGAQPLSASLPAHTDRRPSHLDYQITDESSAQVRASICISAWVPVSSSF